MGQWRQLVTAILLFAVFVQQGSASAANPACTRRLDLVLIFDGSPSLCRGDPTIVVDPNTQLVTCNSWKQILSFAARLIDELKINGAGSTRVAAIRYARDPSVMWSFGQFSSKNDLRDQVLRMEYGVRADQLQDKNSTNTADALRMAREVIFRDVFSSVPKTVLLVTDGRSDYNQERTLPEAERLKASGVDIHVVGVTDSVNENEIMMISSAPRIKNQNWFTSPNFDEVNFVLNRLLRIACCDLKNARSTCRLDIAFIVDRSGSICDNDPTRRPGENSCNNWRTVLQFMVNVTRTLTIGPNSTRVATVLFGSQNTASTKMLWDLNKYTDKDSLERAIRGIDYQFGNTYTTGGLRIAKDEVFTEAGGDRDDVENIAIIITDGKSTIETEKTVRTASQLRRAGVKNRGVTVYSIGVTKLINETELRMMSSPPQALNLNYFTTPDFEKLAVVLDTITRVACCPVVQVTEDLDKCFLDLALIMDASGSICDTDPLTDRVVNGKRTCNNWTLLKSFMARVVSSLPESTPTQQIGTKVGCVVFSGTTRVAFDFNRFATKKQIVDAILDQDLIGSTTNTPAAFRTVRTDIFSQLRGDRPVGHGVAVNGNGNGNGEAVRNVAIIVTDGIPCPSGSSCPPPVPSFTREAISEAERLEKEKDVTVLAVGVTNEIDEQTLKSLSSHPEQEGVTYWSTPNFRDLGLILNQLVTGACSKPKPEPATNCSKPVDIVFVVDTSGSIGESNFEKARQFLIEVVQELDVDSGNVSVGMISFATNEKLIFHLNTHKTRSAIKKDIQGMEYTRGRTNTGAALQFMTDRMFTSQNGDRSAVPNLAIVITDGGSNDKKITTEQAIRAKTTKDVHILSVGMGGWTDKYELQAIASHPYRNNFYEIKNYDELKNRISDFRDYICRNNNPCQERGLCQNGGTCMHVFDGYRCKCPRPYSGKHCQYLCRKPADVVLALDSSGSIGKANFQKVIDFSIDLLDNLPLDDGGQAAMETYSDDAKVYFYLDSFSGEKHRIMNAMTIPYFQGGSTATHIALTRMRTPLFTRGDNPNSPNVGIVITDGRSNNMEETWKQARLTRAADNMLLAIGVGGNVRQKEMEAIASWPVNDNIFNVKDFNSLSGIVERVRDAVCDRVNECDANRCQNNGECVDTINGYYCVCTREYTGRHCERRCDGLADVLFIIDKSGSIRHERFNEVKEFVNNIIMELEVWRGKVQVAAVSFDNTPKVEFRLNAYQTKQDVLQAINVMQYGGGRTNIADALKMGREQIFQQQYGDRQQVPNFIIIFTDGNSNINEARTITEAVETRISGVHILTVGVGTDINMFELVGISSNPSSKNVFTTPSFSTLQTLVSSVYKGICNDIDECASNPCRNSGTCVDGLGKYVCICDSDWTGTNCNRRCRRQMDVAFVVDLSGSVESVYNLSVAFVRHVVSGIDFRFGIARAALVSYSTNAKVDFYLNTYNDKMDVGNAIAFQKTGGRTNTQEALRFVRDSVFQNNKGDRNNVENSVVVLTDGGSNISPQNTVPMANDLKARGHNVYVVAIGEKVDMGEVNGMASSTAEPWVIRLRDQREVEDKADLFLEQVCQ